MRFVFTVEVEVTRESGPFMSKDEIADQIQEALEGADPGTFEGDNDNTYTSDDWSVTRDFDAEKPQRKKEIITRG